MCLSPEEKRNNAKAEVDVYIQKHLPQLCQEILHWHRNGKLPVDAGFHTLASMYSLTLPESTRDDDSYQLAERLVTLAALKAAAAQVDVESKSS